jgi:hypothetical protein
LLLLFKHPFKKLSKNGAFGLGSWDLALAFQTSFSKAFQNEALGLGSWDLNFPGQHLNKTDSKTNSRRMAKGKDFTWYHLRTNKGVQCEHVPKRPHAKSKHDNFLTFVIHTLNRFEAPQ